MVKPIIDIHNNRLIALFAFLFFTNEIISIINKKIPDISGNATQNKASEEKSLEYRLSLNSAPLIFIKSDSVKISSPSLVNVVYEFRRQGNFSSVLFYLLYDTGMFYLLYFTL